VSKIRQKTRRLFWTPSPSPDVVGYVVYAFPGETTEEDALAAILSDAAVPIATPSEPQFFLGNDAVPEGETRDFYVAALDRAGNESDPLFAASWNDVPAVDATPPAPPSGGGIDFAP
jgi:hypothetical protein